MKRLSLLVWLALIPLLTAGCPTMLGEGDNKALLALSSEWEDTNKQQNIALGERVYQRDFDLVFTAVVTGLSDLGLAIKNMERQSGYILAEGPTTLSTEEENRFAQEAAAQARQGSSMWSRTYVTLGNGTLATTITLKRIADGHTKVKMRIAVVALSGPATNKYYGVYPPWLQAEYQKMWQALDRQIFLDENLD